ncbi:hypothetical protein JG688_00013529 [Phytophthora aleatoria]|uniref:Uncharacterized protein n=1 Tax=Phytophthora aleatoria TaxID=2496075 RepID=A0A8J5I9H6_9STRA|nr:hypothetical protein JG688_00013529 [Phytophthora aleatoria]
MDELNAADTLEQLLDDAPPTLLDFLDALEDVDTKADALPIAATVQVKVDNKPKVKTTSNTWRQRRGLEVLRLRDEVKQLDAELKKMKLVAGVKHARKLHRMITQQMTASVVAQALGYRPAFSGDEGRPPTDNNVIFQKLLAEMDGHRGDVNSIFVTDSTDQECGSKKEGHVSVHHARGLKVQLVNSYAVPYSVEATEQAIWNILTEREGNDKNSRVAYNELFEFDSSTT